MAFSRRRLEAEACRTRELAAAEAGYRAGQAQLLEEQRQLTAYLSELLGRVRRSSEELAGVRAQLPAGVGQLGAGSSLALGLAACAGAAVGMTAVLARSAAAFDVTRSSGAWLAAIQDSLAVLLPQPRPLECAALVLVLALFLLLQRSWPHRRAGLVFGMAGLALLVPTHWPASRSAASVVPTFEGLALAAALTGGWTMLAKRYILPSAAGPWRRGIALGVVGVLMLTQWPFGPVLWGLAVIGSLGVERVNQGWAYLEDLRRAARLERARDGCRADYELAAGLARQAQPPSFRFWVFDNLPEPLAPERPERDFPKRRAALEAQRQTERAAAEQRCAQTLRAIDHESVLHGRYHAW